MDRNLRIIKYQGLGLQDSRNDLLHMTAEIEFFSFKIGEVYCTLTVMVIPIFMY